jgi:hypothetical protein
MPAEAGIHVFDRHSLAKSWIPAFAGMTGMDSRCVDDWGGWHQAVV